MTPTHVVLREFSGLGQEFAPYQRIDARTWPRPDRVATLIQAGYIRPLLAEELADPGTPPAQKRRGRPPKVRV